MQLLDTDFSSAQKKDLVETLIERIRGKCEDKPRETSDFLSTLLVLDEAPTAALQKHLSRVFSAEDDESNGKGKIQMEAHDHYISAAQFLSSLGSQVSLNIKQNFHTFPVSAPISTQHPKVMLGMDPGQFYQLNVWFQIYLYIRMMSGFTSP